MKKFLAIILFCLPAFGQAAYSGAELYSGPAAYGAPSSGGAPLTYSARTDNCVTGSESGCIPGATTGEAGSTLSFLLRTTDAAPFADISTGNANMNSTATDPDFGAYLVMATDESTASAEGSSTPWGASWIMGSDGEWDAFSTDSKLLLVHNNNGNATLLYLNPSSIHAQTCATIPCVVNSGVGSQTSPDSSHLASGGGWDFSRVPSESNVLYEVQNPPTAVDRVTICKSTGDPGCSSWSGPGPLLRTPYVDFTSNSPVNCNVLPSNYRAGGWASTFTVATDGTVAYGMGGGQDWTSGMTVTVNETFLFPSLYNAGNKGFQATLVTGVTGATEPNWASACTATCTDGGVTWTDIGGVNSQGPGFDIVVYHPSGPTQGCTRINTRIGKIYRGTGNSAPAGYMTTNDDIACTRAAAGGPVTKPCNLPDEYTLHDMNQSQNGQYILVAPTGSEGANSSGNWNWGTLSGQKSNAIWSGSVLGGSQTGGAYGSLGVYNTADTYATNAVVTLNGYYYTATTSVPAGDAPPTPPILSNSYWTQTEAYPAVYIFDTTSTLVSPCTDYLACNGHQAQGQLDMYWGGKYKSLLYSLPAINGLLNPDTAMLGAGLPSDDHGTYRNAGAQDLTPIFLATTDVPAWSTRYSAACYPEICAVSSDGLHTLYRFGHDYNTGSSTAFGVQNNIGVISYLGDLVAFGTDMMGTRGSSTAANTPCNNLRGMFKPASMTLAPGNTVFPLVGTNGNANGDIFQATIAGATGSSSPSGGWGQVEPVTITQVAATSTTATYTYTTTWGDSIVAGGTMIVSGLTNTQFNTSGSPAGTGMAVATATSSQFTISGAYTPISTTSDSGMGYTTQPWGAATIENIGWNTCRGDVVILDALSAHAAP